VHAVVLVGGFGTRLRPLTNDVPKPMLPVLHRPMIVRLVDRLVPAGITDVVLALGFRPEPFADAFPGGVHHGATGDVRVHYAVEPEPLDTAGAIAFAARFAGVDDTFVVANGDVVTDVDVAAIVARHRTFGTDATIHLTPVEDPSAFGVVECDADGIVERFVEKPAPGESASNLINAGTYVFEPAVLDLIEPERRVSVERDTFPRLVAHRRLAAVATDDYWLDTGRPDQFLQANLDLARGVRGTPDRDAVDADAIVAASAELVGAVVGAHCRLEGETTVADSLLLPGAVVEHGAVVWRSVVVGTVGAGAHVTDSVIGRDYVVADGSTVTGERLPTPD
jgi:mannose-1-phosphate guanylyltransferase